MSDLDPVAEVRVVNRELEELAGKIAARLKMVDYQFRMTLEKIRDVGEYLWKARKICERGKWQNWLTGIGGLATLYRQKGTKRFNPARRAQFRFKVRQSVSGRKGWGLATSLTTAKG